ncbi:MAG: YdeI/OmpD-associated family protein [Dehalococcoidia bacterium]
MELGETLYAKDRRAWRKWLEKHAATAKEIWLVYYTKASNKPSIPYNDAVEEALCFGWIDSNLKPHGPESRAQRFTPRRPNSPLSELNKERVRRLIDAGSMTPAGLAAAGDLDTKFVIPKDILRELKKDRETWENFQRFPESYKRIRIGWIVGSMKQRPEESEKRLRYFLKMTKQNKMYGMVR